MVMQVAITPIHEIGNRRTSLRASHLVSAVALGLALLVLPSCRSPLDQKLDAKWAQNAAVTWSLDETEVSYRGDRIRRASNALDEVDVSPDRVDDWVVLAMRQNAGLRAAQRRVERLQQRRPQVTSLDDPMITVTPFGEMAETAAGQVGWMAGVSQRFPLGSKLDARGGMADADLAVARRDLESMRLEVAAQTRRAYWSHVYAERAAVVVQRDRGLVQQFREVAQAKYRAGTVEQQDVLRAGVELASLGQRLLELEQQRTTAASALNRLADRRIDAPVLTSTDPADVGEAAGVDMDALLDRAARHPRLTALREQINRYGQQRRLAKAGRIPDLTVSLSYSEVYDDGLAVMANGDDQWALGFGINLPIWNDKYSAAEREALAGVMESAAMLTEQQNQLAFAVRDAFARVEMRSGSIALFEQTMLPEARQAVEAAESSYRAGRTDFLTLIDNTRRLTELDLLYQRVLTQLQQDLADLHLAAGLPAIDEAKYDR